jgi:hypothetical protein
MFKEGVCSDVTLEISDCTQGNTVQLFLHRTLLANSCEFLRSMFAGNFCEANQQVVTVEVAKGSSLAATTLVLQYLYTSAIELCEANVMEVLAAADKFQLPSLISSCVQYLIRSINQENACTILNACNQLNLSPLQDECSKFIAKNGKAILGSIGFKKLTKEAAVSVISNQNLDVAEEDVFDAVLAWAQALVHSGEAATISDAADSLLCYLRLDEMDGTFLNNSVSKSGLFPELVVLDAAQSAHGKQQRGAKRPFESEDGDKARCCPFYKRRRIGSVQ